MNGLIMGTCVVIDSPPHPEGVPTADVLVTSLAILDNTKHTSLGPTH